MNSQVDLMMSQYIASAKADERQRILDALDTVIHQMKSPHEDTTATIINSIFDEIKARVLAELEY